MVAIVTGSFDPITTGHLEVIREVAKEYETLYVVALLNPEKEGMFDLNQRKELIQLAVAPFPNVVADSYSGLTADYMNQRGIKTIIRGVRNENDMKYELKLAGAMKQFNSEFETRFVLCKEEYREITSTYIRECIVEGKNLNGLVPDAILERVKEMYLKN